MTRKIFLLIGMAILVSSWVQSDELGELQRQWVDKVVCPREKNVGSLLRDINFYNLINGLHLTKEQIRQIIPLAQQAKQSRDKWMGQDNASNLASLRQELAELQRMKAFADQGKDVPGYAVPGKHSFPRKNKAKAAIVNQSGNREKYMQELKALENSLENILLPAQKQVLADYKPCLIPPKNLRDPVRIGQVANNAHGAEVLARLRQKNVREYFLNTILQKYLEKVEEHSGPYTPEERQSILSNWEKVVQQARAMSDAEFEVAKEELAGKIQPPDKKKELQDMISKERKENDHPGKSAKFLLDPDVIPILEKRLQQMLKGDYVQGRDGHAQAPASGTCEDGSCGDEGK
jgi:hypothetical protein